MQKSIKEAKSNKQSLQQKRKELKQQPARIAGIMLKYMQADQNVIATTDITGDRLGKNQLLFLNFLSMFKKYHLMEMFKQIIGQDNTPVRKQLLQTALFVITRELIDKANTNAAAATVLLPRCS